MGVAIVCMCHWFLSSFQHKPEEVSDDRHGGGDGGGGDGGGGRRVTFTKLVVNKIGAVLKLMQEHLERAGLSNDLEVSV